jgi:hypothetical protein
MVWPRSHHVEWSGPTSAPADVVIDRAGIGFLIAVIESLWILWTSARRELFNGSLHSMGYGTDPNAIRRWISWHDVARDRMRDHPHEGRPAAWTAALAYAYESTSAKRST